MAYVQRVPVRFDDVDFARIVFFPKLFEYCHRVFEDFFGEEVGIPYATMLGEQRVGFPAVHAEADFKRPFRFGEQCRIVMETLKVGSASSTHRYRLYRDQEPDLLCVEVRVVTVAVSLDDHQSLEVPDAVRKAFLRHQAPDLPA